MSGHGGRGGRGRGENHHDDRPSRSQRKSKEERAKEERDRKAGELLKKIEGKRDEYQSQVKTNTAEEGS